MKALKEFLWYKEGDEVNSSDSEHFEKWQELKLISKEEVKVDKEEKLDFDLNRDGKVDKKDRSIAAKLLRSKKGRKK